MPTQGCHFTQSPQTTHTHVYPHFDIGSRLRFTMGFWLCTRMFLRSRAPKRRLIGHISAAMPLISRPGYPVNAICHIWAFYWPVITSTSVTVRNFFSSFSSKRHFLTFEQSIRRTKPPEQRKFHIIYLLGDPTSPQILLYSSYNPTGPVVLPKMHKVKIGNQKIIAF